MSDGYRRDGEPDAEARDTDGDAHEYSPDPGADPVVDPAANPAVDPEADPDPDPADVVGEGGATAATSTHAGTDADAPAHRVGVDAATERTDAAGSDGRGGQLAGAHPRAVDRRFDWRGWILVGAIFVSFLVIPGIIVLYPYVGAWFGLTFWDTYLALPLVPAVVLALLAVWATTRP